jgi:hypothetical protein
MSTPLTSVFVVTYKKDIDFFRYFVKSYVKFARGFTEFVVACPHEDVSLFMGEVAHLPDAHVNGYREHPAKGHLRHQVIKCRADEYCLGDFVAHFDSDCLFTDHCTPEDFFVGDKPIVWRERYADFKDQHPIRFGWQKCVYNATGIVATWEYMCRHPSVYPRGLYKPFREAVEGHTGSGFDDYVVSGKGSFPYEWAEFPTIGAFAHVTMYDKIHWHDCQLQSLMPSGWYRQYPGEKVKMYWSHKGVDSEVKADIEKILSKP